ncbi:hypothetical protein TVAGG3_1062740 [Trichomonas vaginalis G3]|uniref:uncharacterized protein n=1 Tax=Trichomonas vaginalis (strain ATCC PRA-98 / G3) TaxID=412133 RepID=UPI002156ED3B|nr:uncharacterized protein TVAGG3_1062740 [Trichomonas vaginalis G3]KAI5483495.1 hypothetical protein TVAGG3_1062740 [Trichomonas vaginalis G3]
MSDVPPTESIPKPEEPKAPAPAPQFQQVPPNYYQFPPQGYYPPQQFQFQSQSKRDQDFEEGLNRLRKEYATAPIERKLFPDQKIMFRVDG